MDRSFNVVDQPFIPCIGPDGRREERGLLPVLVRAHKIREIRDDSPLVTVSLHRLLLAILHRNFGPADLDEWKALWDARRFPAGTLEAYFEKWRDRFDLCDEHRPFYQDATLVQADEAVRTASWLIPELSRGANATLFDHTLDANATYMSPSQAARALISSQCFSVGGFGPGRIRLKSTLTLKNLHVLCVGENLFETLCLNAVAYCGSAPIPQCGDDAPAWERGEPIADPVPTGYLDYLTWQSRRIALVADTEEAELRFLGIRMLEGRRIDDDITVFDPMCSYDLVDNQWKAKSFRLGRSLWRDSHTLIDELGAGHRPPGNLHQIAVLEDRASIDPAKTIRLAALGMNSNQAKIAFWRHETMPLPLAYLGDPDLRSSLQEAVALAEDTASALGKAVWALGTIVSQIQEGAKADRDRVEQYKRNLAPKTRYWSRLEQPFRNFILDLPGDDDHQDAFLGEWCRTVSRAARQVLDQIVSGLDSSPRTLRAIYQGAGLWGAQKTLNVELAKIRQPYVQDSKETTDDLPVESE